MKWFKFALLSILVFNCSGLMAQFNNPLIIPDTISGPVFNLDLSPGKVQYLPGDSTDTYGINGDYLGPTLIFNKWDFNQMHVTNNIADTTTMHWHGMHVPAIDDGGPHTMIAPGDTWSPDFQVLDDATTFWYHPHLHTKTAEHVYKGAAGMIIIRDSNEASLNLPHTYGVDDFPIIIQDKSFDDDNQFVFAELSDTVMINGTLAPFLEVPAQMVRFRLLNGSNQRVYNIALPPNLPAFIIGSDGGLLEHPLPLTEFILAPGERYEIVIDFGLQPTAAVFNMPCNNSGLPNGASGGPTGPGGGPNNNLDGADFDFIQFRIIPPTANAVFSLPMNLNTITPWDEQDADVTRYKVMDTVAPNSFPFLINSTPYDHHLINDTVWLDDIEIWEISNTTTVAHPFHIHDIQFYILDINGNPPPPHYQGKKDVVMSVPGETIRFIAKFDDFADDVVPYMFHCHNLFHEDGGMMGHFLVRDPATKSDEALLSNISNRFELFPNPSNSTVNLLDKDHLFKDINRVEILDLQGKLLQVVVPVIGENSLELPEMPRGMYMVVVKEENGSKATLRMVKD